MRKSKRLVNHQGLAKFDKMNSLVFYDTAEWCWDGQRGRKSGGKSGNRDKVGKLQPANNQFKQI